MALEQIDKSKIKALLLNPENTPELLRPDLEDDWKTRRVKACREQCGLTQREWDLAQGKFIVTAENRKAYESAQDFANVPDANLLLCGEAGRGKSRIAHGVVTATVKQGVHSVFWTTTKFLMTLRSKSLESDELQAMQELLSPKVLILDDFGANKITEWSLMMMDTLIDDWYRQGRKGLIVTSNFSLDKIGSQISDRIASRLVEMCRVFEMKGKDWRVSQKKEATA